jgi:RNA polymerase sigma-70 factor (sigma-E family)
VKGAWVAESDGFRYFVMSRSPGLVRAAWLLTGDMGTAEDLVQTSLAKMWSRWPQVVRQDTSEAYVRRVMMSTFLTWNRRRWHAELAVGDVPDTAVAGDAFHEVELRWAVAGALHTLPPRQRAVVVLRYFEDLSEVEVARALSCSVGTIKSQNAKAMKHLRRDPQLTALFVSPEEAAHDIR